jgi:hypothetical protein
VAGDVYDEATRTELDRAFQELASRPPNVRTLFNIVEAAMAPGELPVDEYFVRRFIALVPSDLRDYELIILAGKLGRALPARPPETVPTSAPLRQYMHTVCPNCHLGNTPSQPLTSRSGSTPITIQERRAIANWIQAQQPTPANTTTDVPAGSRGEESHAPTPGVPSAVQPQETVCPNCHSPNRRPGTAPAFGVSRLDLRGFLLTPSRRSRQEAKLAAVRAAIRLLPERQMLGVFDRMFGPPQAPVHFGSASRGAPASRTQSVICPNCHRVPEGDPAQGIPGGSRSVTAAERQAIATWLDSQRPGRRPGWPDTFIPGSRSAEQRQETVCPNCHSLAGVGRGVGLPASILDLNAGGGPPTTAADYDLLGRWLSEQR